MTRKSPPDTPVAAKRRGRTYKQFAALPYTVRDGVLQVMLVTSRETRRWVIPKGWPEKNLKGSAVAAKEAYEEAGLVGEIAPKPYADFLYLKRLGETKRKRCRVEVFLFAVHRELDDWPEQGERKRAWMTPAVAATCVAEAGLIKLLLSLRLAPV